MRSKQTWTRFLVLLRVLCTPLRLLEDLRCRWHTARFLKAPAVQSCVFSKVPQKLSCPPVGPSGVEPAASLGRRGQRKNKPLGKSRSASFCLICAGSHDCRPLLQGLVALPKVLENVQYVKIRRKKPPGLSFCSSVRLRLASLSGITCLLMPSSRSPEKIIRRLGSVQLVWCTVVLKGQCLKSWGLKIPEGKSRARSPKRNAASQPARAVRPRT